MRFSLSAFALVAACAVGVHSIDLSDVPGYEALPRPVGNKYSSDEAHLTARSDDEPVGGFSESFETYPVDELEPTHIPEEDLKPSTVFARSVTEPSKTVQAQPVVEEKEDGDDPTPLASGSVDTPPVDFYLDEWYGNGVSSLEDFDENPNEEVHKIRARSTEPYTDSEEDSEFDDEYEWEPFFEDSEKSTLHARSLEEDDEFLDAHYHHAARSAGEPGFDPEEQPYDAYDETVYYPDEGFQSEDDDSGPAEFGDYSEESEPTESYEEEPQPHAQDVPHSSSSSASSAIPAAAPTPKPTSVGTTTQPPPTSASQWSDVASDTATASSSTPRKVNARSVSSHLRFRPHYTAHSSNHVSTATPASASTTSRRGFFKFPW